MDKTTHFLVAVMVTGVGATAFSDLWSMARKMLLGVAPPDFGLVGRWLGYMPKGQFRHDSIAASRPVREERLIGWLAHYLTGIAFAAVLIGTWGLAWVESPTLAPPLIVGIATVAAPFLLMQPGMGAGLAASRTPRPNAARLQSLLTHLVFGIGLYLAGWAAHLLRLP